MEDYINKINAAIDLYISFKYREEAKGIAAMASDSELIELARFAENGDDTFLIIRLDFIKNNLVKHGKIGYETFPNFGQDL